MKTLTSFLAATTVLAAGVATAVTRTDDTHRAVVPVVVHTVAPVKERMLVRPVEKQASRSHVRKPTHRHVVVKPTPTVTHPSRAVAGCTSATWRSTLTSEEIYIIDHEHGLQSLSQASDYSLTHAYNPQAVSTGHAFGLGQLTDVIRDDAGAKLGVNPDSTDPCTQLALLRVYSHERYGTEGAAVAFWGSHGWW